MKEEISKILVKWNMPTRQVAINDIVKLHKSKLQAIRDTVAEQKTMHAYLRAGVLSARDKAYLDGIGDALRIIDTALEEEEYV